MTRVTGRSTSGTLPYMSPEQLRGDSPTPAQDIYSLAATIYECLAGHPPFYRGAIEHQILNETPPSLPAASALSRAIQLALAKDPTRRPSTVIAICSKRSEPLSQFLPSVSYPKQLVSVSMKDLEAVFSQCAMDADEKWLLGCRTGGGLSYVWLIVYNNTRIYVIVTTKRLLFVSRSWWRSAEIHLQVPHSAIARYHIRKDGVSIWMPDGKHYKVSVESRYKKTFSELRVLLPQLAQCTME